MIFFILFSFFLLFLASAEDHFNFGATPASIDPSKCAEYRAQFDKCCSLFYPLPAVVPKSTVATSSFPDECKFPWFYISKTCGWVVTGAPTTLAQSTRPDYYSTAVTTPAASVPMEKRDWTCPPGYHYLTKDFKSYHYFFCCPNDNTRLLLPDAHAALPMCCKGAEKKCKGKPVNIQDTCQSGFEVTDWAGIKGCRGLKRNKRFDDFDVVEGDHHPGFKGHHQGDLPGGFPIGFPHDVPTGFPHGFPGPPWWQHGPTTLDTTSQSKSGTTTLTKTITPPATGAAATQAANDFPVTMDVSEVIFPSATFQWPGGLCDFCNKFKQGKIRQGMGFPFGVNADAASSVCSASSTACVARRTGFPGSPPA